MEPLKSNLEPIDENNINNQKESAIESAGNSFFKEDEDLFKIEKEVSLEKNEAEKDSAYLQIMSKFSNTSNLNVSDDDISDDARNVSQKVDAQSKINHLVDLAVLKGVPHAVKVARHFEDNYVLDAFHDKLMADELHDALVEKGLLKNI